MVLSRGLHPSLHGALMVVATEAMVMAIATQEVALPRWGDKMALCDGKARVYTADNAGAGAPLNCLPP